MKKYLIPLQFVLITFILFYCQTNKPISNSSAGNSSAKHAQEESIDFSVSPVVPASESIKKMQVEEGFEVKLVAAEPLISTPVAMTFDGKGRIWVVEMNGYMPDTVGTGEDIPNGKVVILEDKNKDGVMDDRKIFLDNLVMPRAICLIDNGILVAEPPRLWFYEIHGDQPGKKELVDDKYADGGNVEHQPNGLMRAMDNWIYNAKSDKRYRKVGDRWVKDQTHFRGQWGITQDNYGRLYYNTNSQNLEGDYFAPGLGADNKNQRGVAGFNEKVVTDNQVYPIRPTPGVNRGYMVNILDDSLRLRNFTAACGPVVYRGQLFPMNYVGNVFVAEPSANLIKRNIMDTKGNIIEGRQAYAGKEFISSTDERFRPVNLYNAPDGAMYIVDMYRGIIQHKTYLTTYLKKQIGQRNLTQPLAYGRIYKVVPKNKKASAFTMPANPDELVKLLGHANGWVRDQAQQALLDAKAVSVIPDLRQALHNTKNELFTIHALWTLEGLGALPATEVIALIKQNVWPIRMQALAAIPATITKENYTQYLTALEQILNQNDTLAAPYVAFVANAIQPLNNVAAAKLLHQVAQKYPDNRYVADAVISSLSGQEETFAKEVLALVPNATLKINQQFNKVNTAIQSARNNRDPKVLLKQYPRGAAMFNESCQTCHGADGNGVKSLAPPLNQSEWVTGDKDKLISIVLYGLTGPVEVNGHNYKAPEINGDMPGIGYNPKLSNEDVAQLLSFIRKSWRNNADKVSAEEVLKVRQKLKDRQKAFTVKELNNI